MHANHNYVKTYVTKKRLIGRAGKCTAKILFGREYLTTYPSFLPMNRLHWRSGVKKSNQGSMKLIGVHTSL